jgi:imidazolonepropionase-like amidohydrolase
MKKIFSNITALLLLTGFVQAQETVYPVAQNRGTFVITGGTVHIGNGQVIENGTVEVVNGKITKVGTGSGSTAVKPMQLMMQKENTFTRA